MKNLTVETARKFLEQEGYYTRNMWHIDDVCMQYDCDRETAMNILNDVLQNDWTMMMISDMITETAEFEYELERKEL